MSINNIWNCFAHFQTYYSWCRLYCAVQLVQAVLCCAVDFPLIVRLGWGSQHMDVFNSVIGLFHSFPSCNYRLFTFSKRMFKFSLSLCCSQPFAMDIYMCVHRKLWTEVLELLNRRGPLNLATLNTILCFI